MGDDELAAWALSQALADVPLADVHDGLLPEAADDANQLLTRQSVDQD